jgi:hypothetical protein
MKTWIVAGLALITAFATSLTAQAETARLRYPASSAAASKPSKREMIQRLKTLQERQASELATLESAIRKQLQDSMTLNVAKEDVRYSTAKAGLLAKKVDELNKRRSELNARREIVDRLIFAIDSKYGDQPIQQFLETQFLEMASTDLAEGRDSRMWKVFTYLSIAIREVPEPREDMFDVIEGYMNFSSVLEPKTPAEFLASRNYTNGTQNVAANPVSRDQIGDDVDATEVGRSKNAPRALELRMTMPVNQQASTAPTGIPDVVSGTVSGSTQGAGSTSQPAAVTN